MAGHGFALNPLIYACFTNEDVVGRLARLSRRVSPKLPSQRTLELYLIQCKENSVETQKVMLKKLECALGVEDMRLAHGSLTKKTLRRL